MTKITEFLVLETAVKELKGRNTVLRPSKPGGSSDTNGLMQYIWRMVRFHSGKDVTMPFSCDFYLQDWLDNRFGKKTINILYGSDQEGKEIRQEIDSFVDLICVTMKLNPLGACKRYRGLLY